MRPTARVTNTANQKPIEHLAGILGMGQENYILSQEADGQAELAKSDLLPVDRRDCKGIEAAGVTFGPPLPTDPIFCAAQLPPGWRIQPTNHSMWSKLLDANGRERASIFYKAAFYDRSCHMHATRRYCVKRNYDQEDKTGDYIAFVMDGDRVIHETVPERAEAEDRPYEAGGRAQEKAEQWLTENFPDWRNVGAYWENINA